MADTPKTKNTVPPPLPPIVRKTLRSGLINPGAVSENDRPESSVMESLNFHFDAIGSATLRKGSTRLGDQKSGNILGMHYLVDTVAGTNTQTIMVNGTVAYYLAGGTTWTSIRTGLTAASKARFVTYLNFAFMVNGTEATAIWDGNTGGSWVTTGNAANAPTGKFIENFRGRVWIAGNTTYPSRLYYSSVPSSETTPVITWNTDVATGQWIDISPSDGDKMSGLQRFRNKMLVFKTNRIYRVMDIGQTDPDPWYAVGTYSMESVLETKAGVFFHHSTGFYQYNTYDVVQEISRPIWDIVRAIPTSAYEDIAGWVEADGDHVCWSVGNVTVNGTAYTNLVVRYTISTMTWTHYSYPTQVRTAIKRQPLYNDGTTQFSVVGDTAGNVIKMNLGKDDLGTPISYSLIHKWDMIDGLLSTRKNIQTGNFTHYRGSGSNVAYQDETFDPDNPNDWRKKVGQLNQANTGFNTINIKARKVRFRVFGQSSGEPFIYNGYELLAVTNEFIQFT